MDILHELVTSTLKDNSAILYYQQLDISVPKDSSEHYYQLTLSNNLWLQQAHNFVVKDNLGYGTPIAFGLLNKENNYTIRLAVEAV
ncbi:gephyrin: PROVISIONAL [Gigaspora margarita]|uniref:Gephyrin: PROVISIONAL n=1 Tax=Gigaspora margarita TaxID=4874 RepID=A0A8H4B0N6_GIGMA|nr:gephyrin: PROVISIONAL [Gigaspora margarita]